MIPNSRRGRISLVGSILLAAMPVTFGLIRAVSTRNDVRYLWLAASAILGSMLAMRRGRSGSTDVSVLRAVGTVAAGSACAAATATLMGATAGPGVAIVAMAFGFCAGASAAFATLARQPLRPTGWRG